MPMRLPDTTIRDFGGGWNTSDSDLNLSSRYQPISDNIARGIDGSFSPRMGVALDYDFRTGSETTLTAIPVDITTTLDTPAITFEFPAAHGLTSGNHVTIAGLTGTFATIEASEINGTHAVLVVNATTVKFYVRAVANATATTTHTVDVVTDTHLIGGNIIHDRYFNRRLIVFTDIGEIATAEPDLLSRIWGIKEADDLSSGLVPTRRCEHWSSDPFKSSVIACNGYNRDKPIQIFDDFSVEFLIDKATLSNSAVPKADYVVCLQGYVCFLRTEYGDPVAEFSAKGTDGTFTRDPNPADSVEIDLSMITASVEPVLLGAAPIRDKLYAAFYDKGMIGTLGTYDENGNHVPDFSDTIAENGTVSHRTMVSLGNDVLMCDYAGVPSVGISQQSGVYTPVRLSELIAPSIQQHLSSLAETTLRQKSFAVFNRADKSYMLFLPIYDEVAQPLDVDPFIFNDELRAINCAVVRKIDHKLFERSCINIAGAVDIGSLSAADINGVREVRSIINKDTFVIQLGGKPLSADDTSGGGSSVSYTPINDESIVYSFEYNKEFKLRRWTRYRGWNFQCGTSSQRGTVYLCQGLKVYRLGNNEKPVYADYVNDYDYQTWEQNKTYVLNDRVRDDDTGVVWQVIVDEHTSPATGTFANDRAEFLDDWTEYRGEPIDWMLDTPWSDMQTRGGFKVNKYITIDSEGYGRFTVSAFVNKILVNKADNEPAPYRSLDMQGGDTGGWDNDLPNTWGSGRRTREEKVWPFGVRGKLIRWRFQGSTRERLKITSLTMYYKIGNLR